MKKMTTTTTKMNKKKSVLLKFYIEKYDSIMIENYLIGSFYLGRHSVTVNFYLYFCSLNKPIKTESRNTAY